MGGRRGALLMLVCLFQVAFVRVAVVWERLPPNMASHFGIGGQPDGFMSRSGFFIFYMIVCGGTVALLASVPIWLRWIPTSLVNLPNREYWLTPERREATLARLGAWMAWFCVAMTAFMLAILEMVLRVNLERTPLPTPAFLIALGTFFAVVIAWIVALYRAFRLPDTTH
jgi:uncharacterized membrane protein